MTKISQLNKYEYDPIWINWFWSKDDKGNPTKVPLASSTDPSSWKVFSDLDPTKLVGMVFPPSKLILGIDIDHCLEKGTTNIIHPQKEAIVNLLIEADTYTEISVSGTGLHLYLSLRSPLNLGRNKIAPFEAYTSGRFFAVTGKPYKEEKPIREVSPEEALGILSLTGYDWAVSNVPSAESVFGEIQGEDDKLLDLIFNSKGGEKFRKLYEGDKSDYGNDDSSADMALCTHLAWWTQGNYNQIERLWIKSPLSNRAKTLVRKDYRPMTIQKAIKNCKDFYKPPQSQVNQTNKNHPDDHLVLLKSSDVVCKQIDWLWKDKIAKGKVTLVAGDPGLGKSQMTVQWASIVSNGGEFPGGEKCKRGKVLFCSAEDDPADTEVPRLVAYGADLEQVSFLSMVKRKGEDVSFNLKTDIDLLANAFKKEKDISLLIIDPVTAFLGETDSYKNAEVRALLHQLSKVATEYNVAVVGVTHFSKSSNGGPMNKFTGSLAFIAAARAAYVVLKDEQDEKRRLFLPVKNNLAKDTGGFAFSVESVSVERNGIKIETSKIVWEKEPVLISAVEAMKQVDTSGGVDKKTVEWIESYLRKYPGGVSFNELRDEAQKKGISRATLYRAGENMIIDKIYQGKGKPKKWRLAFDESGEDVDPDSVPI